MPHLLKLGLFGSNLSENSLANMYEENPDNDFEFIIDTGWGYDYGNDLEYINLIQKSGKIVGNLAYLDFLKENKLRLIPHFLMKPKINPYFGLASEYPLQAEEPYRNDNVGYIWPSYITWDNDPSYISFLGVPDKLELPKHVLRKTSGHPEYRHGPRGYLGVRFYDKRIT